MRTVTSQKSSDLSAESRGDQMPPQAAQLMSVLFAGAVFLSAFLLFQMQPLISKSILPWFGGTPGVWTTCMLFFQLLLCGGYLYAHLITAYLPPFRQGLLHAALLGISLVFLDILPSVDWKPTGSESPALRIVLLLLATVGLPYFILSTTGPLLLRWFSLILPRSSPYRLYALSNAGSLLALLSYPTLFEPLMRISTQATYWSAGFLLFAILCGACIIRLCRLPASESGGVVEAKRPQREVCPITFRTCCVWFSLGMVASTMLLATTNEVCQDVAVIPFLWVIPLSLYLLSFILCFESDRWYYRGGYALGTCVLVLAVCWLQSFGLRTFLPLQLLIYFATLFSICMLCHGELARMRPDPKWLTTFYLTLSAGGAGGGVFVGLLAPYLFPGFWELFLGLIASCVIALQVSFDHRGWMHHERRPPVLAVLPAIALFVGVGTVFAAAVMNYAESIAMVRNFYGVLEVEHDELEDAMTLRHGRILHGVQLNGIPSLPTMYYGYRTGAGRAIEELREQKSRLKIGLVGLGVGTLAAYGRDDDVFRFYEINENVTRLARQHFTFLKNCPSHVDILHGDARLMLENESPQEFDLLVLDAFSGDAIPTHLLTQEAVQSYLRHLQDDGVIAIHISNIHFDLRRVTEALAAASDLHAITLETSAIVDPVTGTQSLINPGSRWVLLARNAELLDRPRFQEIAVREAIPTERYVLWTDDFSNLIEVLDW